MNCTKELKLLVKDLIMFVGTGNNGDDDEHFDTYFDAMNNLIEEIPVDRSKKNTQQLLNYIDSLTILEFKKIVAPMTIKKLQNIK